MDSSQLYHDETEASEQLKHMRRGHHTDSDVSWENERIVATVDFDFAEIDRRLEGTPIDAEPPSPELFRTAAEMLSSVLAFLAEGQTPQAIGLRAVALIYGVRPDMMLDRWPSVTHFAAAFNLTKQAVSKYTHRLATFAPQFQNGYCFRGAELREKHRLRAISQHLAAGHKVGDPLEARRLRDRRKREKQRLQKLQSTTQQQSKGLE